MRVRVYVYCVLFFCVHFTFNLAPCVVLVKLIEMAPTTARHNVVQQATRNRQLVNRATDLELLLARLRSSNYTALIYN